MAERLCRVCGKWHDLDQAWPSTCYPKIEIKRSDMPCPRLATDHMTPVQSMLDGRMYDSKSALRATYRAAGVTEVGNDPARLRPRQKPKTSEKAVRDTVEKAAARYARGERATF